MTPRPVVGELVKPYLGVLNLSVEAESVADQLLHDALRDQLATRLRIPIQDKLQEMQRELEAGLNREIEGGTLHGTVHRMRLIRLQMQPDALLAGFKTDGDLRYDLRD